MGRREGGNKTKVCHNERGGRGRRVVCGRKGFSWVVEEWEGVRAHFCQFKQRHLSEGATGVCLQMCVCVFPVYVCVYVIRQARG